MPKVKTKLTPFTSNFTTEVGEYYGLAADKDIKEMLGDPKARLLFTENQIKVAYERWKREGCPKFIDEKDKLAAAIRVKNTIIKDMENDLRRLKSRRSWLRRLFDW